MSVKNFYPEKPTVPFRAVHVEMGVIINAIKSLSYPNEVKRAAYIVIRNETGNGNSVICGTNVAGFQSDSGRWPDVFSKGIVGVCYKNENKTGAERGFLVFDKIDTSIAMVCDRVQAKGVFIGEHVDGKYYHGDVTTPAQEAEAYQDEWVEGETVKVNPKDIQSFVSMYEQSKTLFP